MPRPAEGNRVARGTPAGWPASGSTCSAPTSANGFALTNSYVLGPGGEQFAEANGAGNWMHTNIFAEGKLLATYGGSDTYFALTDWLGTKRVEVSANGYVSSSFSLPFGNGLSSTGNAPDATEHHFTGKERDSESGNDYFGTRYYASTMGRMLSPDPVGGSLANPQTLNKYAYVLNNPLVNTDPTGMYVCSDSGDKTKCDTANDQKVANDLADARNAAFAHLSGADLLNALNAINAYGKAGEDNGVTIGFNSNLSDSNGNPVAGLTQVSGVANGTKSDLNPNGQNISVTFNPDQLNGAGGAGLVAHEGSHVADGAAWVASGFSFSKDPTNMMTELKAYHVGSDITLGVMMSDPRWDGTGLPPSYLYSGHNSSASRFVGEPWSGVEGMFRDFIKDNYSNVGSPAFIKGTVVPR